jgi:hypothetical protein
MRAPCDGEAAGAAPQAVPPSVALALDVAVELDVADDEVLAQALDVGSAGSVDGTVGVLPPGEVAPAPGCVCEPVAGGVAADVPCPGWVVADEVGCAEVVGRAELDRVGVGLVVGVGFAICCSCLTTVFA